MTHYVPLLKAKEGEFRALARLADDVKQCMTPLLEAPPLDGYGDLEPPAEPTVDSALDRVARKLEKSWGGDRPFFLDLGLVECDPLLAGGEQPLAFVFSELRDLGLEGLPVTGLGRDPAYTGAVRDVCDTDGRGVCFRVTGEDLEDPEAAVQQVLAELNDLDLGPEECDLIVDVGALGDRIGPIVAVADLALRDLAQRDRWRTLTLAGTAFPDVSAFGPDSVNVAPRLEWRLWQRVCGRGLPRIPDFGDYGIFGTQTIGSGMLQFGPSPNLRYTTDDEWLIFKARAPRHGFDQFNALCNDLVSRPDFAGADFSWADGYIAACAAGTDGPGNGTTWIQVHPSQREIFTLEEGDFELLLGGRWRKLTPGETLTVEPGETHTYRNRGAQTARVRTVHEPGLTFEEYIRELHATVTEHGIEKVTPAMALRMAALWRRHSETIRPGPAPMRFAFAVLGRIGPLLGVRPAPPA